MATHLCRIAVRHKTGLIMTFDSPRLTTPEDAYDEALWQASDRGWRAARWWEFWRYGDTKVELYAFEDPQATPVANVVAFPAAA